MRVAVLFSGGKDSTYALYLAKKQNHQVISLVTIKPKNPDSYMYHSLNTDLTRQMAEAADLPLVIAETKGEKEKELKELKQVLADLKKQKKIEGVVAGAVASNYQKERLEKICKGLKLKLIVPLWHKNQEQLLKEILKEKFTVIVTGIYAGGLKEEWIGKELDKKNIEKLIQLSKKFRFSLIGEGGELETLVIDCPLFKKKLKIVDAEKKWDGMRGEFIINKVELARK